MAGTYLLRTPSSASNRKTWTWSAWVKRSELSASNQVLFEGRDSSGFVEKLQFNSAAKLEYDHDIAGTDYTVRSDMVFRDTSNWYHIMVAKDTTQATETNRIKVYVNGEQQTLSEYQLGYPPQNYDGLINSTNAHYVGSNSTSEYFSGLMSHIHFIDGTAYDASAFGKYDANGVWTIKTSPSVTYGTNGFFILKDGNSVTDQSGRGNNFTVGGGTLTDLKDNPDNVFATMNALSKSLSNVVLSKGNTIIRNDASANGNVLGTIALGNGKYYWENYRHGGGNIGCGLTLASVDGSNHSAIHGSRVNYYQDGNIYQNGFGLSDINTGVTYSDTDIIGVSVDTEGGTIKFYKNGALVNNSSQTNSAFTYAQNELIPFWYVNNGGEWRTNFGNGYFGTTAITSAGTNASGNGIFEYDVQPTDATALSTKGLNL